MIDSCIYVSIKVSFSLFCQPCHRQVGYNAKNLDSPLLIHRNAMNDLEHILDTTF